MRDPTETMSPKKTLSLFSCLLMGLLSPLARGADYSPDIWLDGADATSVVLSAGGNVERWIDKSGNGNDALAPSTTNQPGYNSSTGSLEFDGVDDGLRITGANTYGPNNEVTVFVVVQLDDKDVTQSILTDIEWTTFCKRFALHYWDVSFGGYYALYGDDVNGDESDAHALGNRDTDRHMVSFRYDGSTFHASLDGSSPALQSNPVPGSGGSDLMLGNSINFARNALNGRIHEVIIYKKALTAQQVLSVEYDLHNKWSLPFDKTHTLYSEPFGIVSGQRFSVTENSAERTVIGTPQTLSVQPGFSPSDWQIEAAGIFDETVDVGAFTIDPDTGEISVADNGKPDFERYQTHRIAVSMSDGTTRSRAVEVDIDVIDASDGDSPKVHSELWGVAGELWDAHGRLPDYSHAGYHSGEVPIPDHPEWPVIDVTDPPYNADPTDAVDDTAAIQSAIDAAPASGAVVFMPAGTYYLETRIVVERGNLILRGAGRDAGGTVLYCPNSQTDLGKDWLKDSMIQFTGKWWIGEGATRTPVAEAHRGDRTLLLDADSGWVPGQTVYLWLNESGPDLQGPLWDHMHNNQTERNPEPSGWAGAGDSWPYTVERVDGRLVTFKEPFLNDVRLEWTPTLQASGIIGEIGMEDFKMEFNPIPQPDHLVEPGYNGIGFKWVEHSWMRRIGLQDTDNGLRLSGCSKCTIEDILFTGRAGHHGLTVERRGRNLVHNLVYNQTSAFIHSATITQGAAGCVVSEVSGNQVISCDSHGDSPHQNLWTCITTPWNYNSSGTAGSQPHAAHGTTYWNLTGNPAGAGLPGENYRHIGTTVVGPLAITDSHTISREWYENIQSVSPANLYDAQLDRRLNPPPAPLFASAPFGLRSNWMERDPSRWKIENGNNATYTMNFSNAPAMPGGRLGEYSILTAPDNTIAVFARSLEDFSQFPDADLALILGYQDDDNYLYASANMVAGATIHRVQNGTRTQLAADPSILLDGNTWRYMALSRNSTTLTLHYGTQQLQATDSVFTSGLTGIGSTVGQAAFDSIDLEYATSFADWALVLGLPADPEVDDDDDGLGNFHEYAFDLQPHVRDAPSILSGDADGNISYTVRNLRNGVTYTVETSPDLDNWSPFQTLQGQSGGTETIVSIPYTLDLGTGCLFVRQRLEE